MNKITVYPLGNADTCLLTLDHKYMLCDYAAKRNPDDPDDRRCNLAEDIKEDINYPLRDHIETVAFTHLDDDHICGASEFFFLEHAEKYQGEGRVKIDELWVPASAITEEGAEDEARIIRQEARHRLKQGWGIRVFSRPAHLKAWLEKEGLSLESRAHLITDAGRLVPGWSKETDGVEFFVHSPFGERDGTVVLDRNERSLVFQATFRAGNTKFLMAADTPWDIWTKIVRITRMHGNAHRLAWDVYKLPHHCSYLTLSPEKGTTETKPTSEVQWLLDQGQRGAIVISTSKPIDAVEDKHPPHFQAKNCYLTNLTAKAGKFKVTMEHPNRVSPARMVIKVTAAGASLETAAGIGSGVLVGAAAPRVG
ncbi:hypothetical protein [Oleiharenicola lentus]|uniref:hypothetical protein n=1 Tax=Oleiharenicola lentus TaxID=2508720 RepID=UPI003F67C6FA